MNNTPDITKEDIVYLESLSVDELWNKVTEYAKKREFYNILAVMDEIHSRNIRNK